MNISGYSRKRFIGSLLATVSTFGFYSNAFADTQTITGIFQGPGNSHTYTNPVIITGASRISGGAQISAPEITGGAPPADAALITVMGAGSQLSATQGLVIGAASDAYIGTTLSIASGGAVSADSVSAGLGDGTLGTINLTAYNAGDTTHLVTNTLNLGVDGGNGVLNIAGQGGGSATATVNRQLVIGKPDAENGLGPNTVWVSGAGSVLEVGGVNGIQASGTAKDYTFTLAGGTLRNINSDLTSSVNITLGNNSSSTIDTGHFNTRVDGALTGAGNLIKTGSGTLTLTGDNQYAHGTKAPVNTIIQSGTLAASPLSLRGVGTIQDNASLLVNQSLYTGKKTAWPDMLSNTITGTGSLVKDGAQSVALTGTNTYTGATIVRQGTLQLGYYGGTTGSINNSAQIQLINKSSNLTVYRGDDVTVAPSITGAGSVTKLGGNTLTLTGTNTYTGVTTVDQGTLQLGANGGTTGSINNSAQIQLVNKSSNLTVDRGDDVTVAPSITGAGSLTKLGANTLTLTGTNTYTGATVVDQGTLQLGANGGTTGSINNSAQIQLVNKSSNLTVDRGDDVTVAPSITGEGSVTKLGGNTLTLTGTNTYTGATVVYQGTLQLGANGGTTGSINNSAQIQLVNKSSNLTVDRGDDVTVAPSITGAGSLTKLGGNTLTLTGTNTYTGVTTVDQGTLQLGANGGTTGSINNSAQIQLSNQSSNLTVDRGDDVTVVPSITGAGSVTKLGANTLTLAGNNTYAGGTSVRQGMVMGGVTSFGTGAITLAQNTALAVTQSEEGTFSNTVSGTGQFIKDGAGMIDYAGESTGFSGKTDIRQGALSVSGNLQNSDVQVEKTAMLAGQGTVGGADVFGTFAPGQTASSAFGAMQVRGNVTMESGSTFAANVRDNLGASRAVVSGTFAIQPDATLAVTAQAGANLLVGQHYTLVQATNGVTGKFAHYDQTGLISTHSLILAAQPGYADPNEVQIVLERNRNLSFGFGADTRNEVAAGAGLDSIADNSQADRLTNLVAGLGDQQRYRALDSLSGEIHASAKTAMVNNSFYIRNTALNRLECAGDTLRRQKDGTGGTHTDVCDVAAEDHALSVWGTVYGSVGHNSASSGTVGLKDSAIGWIMGADTMVGNWRVGGLLAYGRTMFSNNGDRNSNGHSNNATIGLYGGTAWRVGGIRPDAQVTLRLGADYTWNMINARRTISIPGYSARTTSNSLGGTGEVYGESGYRFTLEAGHMPLALEPFVRMAYVNYQSDNFHEHGDIAALRARGTDQSIGYSAFGLKAATRFKIADVAVAPHASVSYRRAFGKTDMSVRENFRLAAGNQGYSMDVMGAPLSIDTAVVQTGVTAKLTDRLNLNVDYIGQYGSSMTTSGGSGKITYSW